MQMTADLRIVRLILVGHRKNYIVHFNPGVNIIYGDADTGKSSILELVYYLLGSKAIQVDQEIASSVMYAVLETRINDDVYTIKRDIYNHKRPVEVYRCGFEDISKNYPVRYSSSLKPDPSTEGSLSAFLLQALNLPQVKIKESPSKDDSGLDTLSIRDLFKFCYLDQDAVGSRTMLDIGNYVVEVKNREVFKYIFNVLDTNINDVESDIARLAKERNELFSQQRIISKFLLDTEFASVEVLDREISEIEEKTDAYQEQLSNINNRMVGDSELYNALREALDTINRKIDEQEAAKETAITNIEKFSRLHNDYVNDVEKLISIEKAREIIGEKVVDMAPCPICNNLMSLEKINESFSTSGSKKVRHELNTLRRRSKDLAQMVNENRDELTNYSTLLDGLYVEKARARQILDEELQESISPYISERDAVVSELAALKERREKYGHLLKVRNQQKQVTERAAKLEMSIDSLKERLKELKENAPSLEVIVANLGKALDEYLSKINIKNRKEVYLSEKTYLPVLRGVEYRHLNSGGLRTIVSIGFLSILLRAALFSRLNLPSLLMIDTVGKYLGKTKGKGESETDPHEDEAEGISDPDKYKNIYEYLIALSEEYEQRGRHCQILLVDNDVPPQIAERYSGFVIAHYSSAGLNGLPVGLIDDWDVHTNQKYK